MSAAGFWIAVGYWSAPVSILHFDQLFSSHAFRLAIDDGLRYVAGSGDVQR